MNSTLISDSFPKKTYYLKRDLKAKNGGESQKRTQVPSLFRALDGVGDHRALYHIPNNIIFYLGRYGI